MKHLGEFPKNIPRNVPNYYGKSFLGWGDFLGTGQMSPSNRRKQFLPFEEARAFARSLGLKSSVEWYAFRSGKLSHKEKMPDNIPSSPSETYCAKWTNWQDWLGAPDKQSKWRPFAEARAWARTLGLRTAREWFAYCDGKMPDKPPLPSDIPKDVYGAYEKKGWQGIHDWLGVT